jgi:hypothetical protein
MKQKRNETKKIINKLKNKTNQQSIKCQWRIEKPLQSTGRFDYGRKKLSGFHIKKLTIFLLPVCYVNF